MTNILPRTDDPDTAPFWRAARERRLVVQECDACVYKPTLPAFAPYTPFPIAYIELEDLPGVRMTGNLVAAEGAEINSVPHDQVMIGLRVKAVFADVADDVTMPRWTPVAEGAA
jgi:uncharacterized OB-fold protein